MFCLQSPGSRYLRLGYRGHPWVSPQSQLHFLLTIRGKIIYSPFQFRAPQQQPGFRGFAGDPSLAKILQEQRFNVANTKFGHAAEQEDGVILMEQSDGNNNRIGAYQYVGDDGKVYTVKYEAGVNGFR